MDNESKPMRPSDRPRQSTSEAKISSGKGANTALVPLATATSLALSTQPDKHGASALLPDHNGPPPAASGSTAATQVPAEEPRHPAGVRESEAGPTDGAKQNADAATQASATTAQSRARRRRQKKPSSPNSRTGTEVQPDLTSRRKERRSKRSKSKATTTEGSVAASERRQPGGVSPLTTTDAQSKAGGQSAATRTGQDLQNADVGGVDENEQKDRSKSVDTRQNERSREPVSHADSPCDAAKTGTVGAELMTVEVHQSQTGSVACGRTESNKASKSRGTVKVCSPDLVAQPCYGKWRRGSEPAKTSGTTPGANEGTASECHGKRRLSTYSYTTLQELATSLKSHTTPGRGVTVSQRSNNEAKYLPFLVLFAFVFVSIVSLLLWFMGNRIEHAAHSVCMSAACAELAAAFDGVLNYSVDPCDDLDAFVCPKGSRRGYGAKSGGRGAQSVVEQVIRDYELQMVKLFVDGDTAFTASAMVAEFLQECSYGRYETPPSVESFREFFAHVSVPWPFDPPGGSSSSSADEAHPLEAVLKLTLKWGIDTWFHAYVHTVGRGRLSSNYSRLPALFVETGAQASSWLNFVRTLHSINSREKYYRLFYAHYNATPPESGNLERELAVEKDVLTALDAARSPGPAPRAVVTSIEKLADAVANTTLENWLNPVIDAPGGHSADSSTMAAVQDVRVLRAVQHLTNTYTAAALMQHLSWWLVQILTVIGWPQGYVVIAGSQEAARSDLKLECYRIMADRFGLLMAAESAVKLFSRQAQQEVTHFFTDIISLLASAAAKAPWMSDEAKQRAARLLQDLEVVTWPPEGDESNATLSALYAGFCNMCIESAKAKGSTVVASSRKSTMRPLLMDYWWQVSRKFWHLSPEQRERMQWLWQEHQFEVLRYEPWNNRLRVSHAALSSLLYHPESSARRTANFGGLGAAFVLNVLQMFERPAADFNTDVATPSSNIRDIFRRAQYLNCSDEFVANVRDVFAMGLAWQALKAEEKAADKERHGRHWRHGSMIAIKDENRVEHLYGEDQLFFLTYCRSRCIVHRRMERGPDCNAAVRGTADFGRAFRCDVGTPMVPRNACHVSDFF